MWLRQQKNFRGLGRTSEVCREPVLLFANHRDTNFDLVRHLDASGIRHPLGDHFGHLAASGYLDLASPRLGLANLDAFRIRLHLRLAFGHRDFVRLDLFPPLGHAHGIGLLYFPVLGDRHLASANLLAGGRNADRVSPRFRLHDTSANRVVFRPLLGHGFWNLDRVGLLDLLAFRDRNLLGPSFFTSGRNADGIVPRFRLHDTSANGIVFRPLLGHALGNPHAVGLLDLAALRDRYLPSSDFFASGRNADGIVPRLRLHHAEQNCIV